MWRIKFTELFLFFVLVFQVVSANLNTVKIDAGLIKGLETALGFEYRGIPYAEPPVGLLRFAAPKPYSRKWSDVREFVKFGPSCAQYSHYGYRFVGDEDCLTLNVYVPRTARESSTKAPVIVFIHGGNFMYGGSDVYGPENFMNHQKMILVTMNYRVGVLGFLSTEDNKIPGNFGLKDQVEALKWVQKNIAAFNGDPKQVTLSGFQAGGASVHLHYMSPLSEGLFSGGISHSGNALDPWVMMEMGEQKTFDLALKFLCRGTSDHENILKCLRTKPAKSLVESTIIYHLFLYNPSSPFGVVVEPKSDTAFLTEHPEALMKDGKLSDLPWLLSQVKDEGLYHAVEFAHRDAMDHINENWLTVAPALLDYGSHLVDDEKKMLWSLEIQKEYFKGYRISLREYFSFKQVNII